MNTLGQRIAYYRKAANLTQAELAEQCSVTAQAVSKWENDLTAPDIALLPKLAQIFRITVDELLGAEKRTVAAVDPAAVDVDQMLLRIRVLSGGGDKVDLNVPLALAMLAFESENANINLFGGKDGSVLKDVDFKQVLSLVRQGAVGKLVEVQSADGDTVEIWVE